MNYLQKVFHYRQAWFGNIVSFRITVPSLLKGLPDNIMKSST